ncbi:MAG TPA: dihydroneopterin aldolase [Actinomycetes bacterium]|jgi:dihydroneopterin aldolase|nr:dihydroneopterin aldolase [Actinomycetes bacterium]
MSLASAGLDRILVRNLRVFGHHGVLPEEAEHGQVFVIDLDLAVDLRPAGRSDDLERTVDYGTLTGRVAELVAARRRNLVEAVAEDVADLVLADGRVREVRVRVAKPHASLPADAEVAVEVVRGRREPAAAADPDAGAAAAPTSTRASRKEAP